MKKLILSVVSCLWMSLCARADTPITGTATPDSPVKRRVEEAKGLHWGMFVCWSFSTFSGKEWTPGVTNVSLLQTTGCDTEQWVKTAKEAQMGYVLFLA